ncbi:hypothetical protein OAB88_08600, partial [Winogradskyella sp.]|nr:hypothetical protein [Winogradskyella sp.]
MKKITLLIVCLVGFVSFAQVNITANFDAGVPAGWTNDFTNTDDAACAGFSERHNTYGSNATANLTTANEVAASNATDLTISFDYKITDYYSDFGGTPDTPTPAGWGTAELQYSLDDGTTWTTILTIDDSNHVVAGTCAAMMATVPAASLPSGSDVKLQIINTWAAGDYFFYVDNFVAQQELGCVSPIGTAAFASEDCLAGTFNVDFDITDLGDGGLFLFDGTTSTPIAAVGMFTLSYPIGTPVSFTLQHGTSAVCDVDLGTVSDTGLCPIFVDIDCSLNTPLNTTFCYGSSSDIRYVFT